MVTTQLRRKNHKDLKLEAGWVMGPHTGTCTDAVKAALGKKVMAWSV